jgi:hypothetical protein
MQRYETFVHENTSFNSKYYKKYISILFSSQYLQFLNAFFQQSQQNSFMDSTKVVAYLNFVIDK